MLSIDFYKSETKKINDEFSSTYLSKIEQFSKFDFGFYFNKNKTRCLFVSLNSTLPFLLLKDLKLNISLPSNFLKNLKQYLLNSKLINAEIGNEDNIVVLNFLKIDDLYDKINYQLIIEFFRLNSNIILVKDGKIIDCYHHKSLDTKNPQIPGIFYKFPAKSQYFKNITKEDINFFNNYIDTIEEKYLKEKYKKYITLLKKKEKSLKNKIKNLNIDLANANERLVYKEYGDYCLMNLNNLKKGDTFFNYQGKEIPLDIEMTPTANMNHFYKVYKKAKMTIEYTNNQLDKTYQEIEYIDSILSQIDFYNEKDYEELLVELSENKLINVQMNKKEKTKISSAISPYYYEYNGVKIGIGKNNLQNDNLTFKHANKTDTFLHVLNDFGPHVIIFDSNPSNEILELAASMALYGAKRQDGDVMYTKVSNVKKTSTPGLARIKTYKSIHISSFKFDMAKIFDNLKRF